MEISILLTILLIVISLGGLFLQGGKIYLINKEHIDDSLSINYDLNNASSRLAVKLVLRGLYLLNNVISNGAQKATKTALIQLQNYKFEG
ncbi:hypothetical protein [Falsiporphyromonas endometrii]|uniref:Uncharacterized protein n=1 Tax=Falsiporphyromonas endometrii TaxID=1387297 RepID=A0ABV9KAU6_9PORP